ncbi:GNAT family N-acetyltransferase [Dysgonomonas sp. ZJ709]|uniref:GNAT family N-acetyltransferase n=1 Tax=Dysgonomonas sp. ZJ709 TaxID=2709797 RepID=UPI0013ED3CC9|nr:GNAT family N-acetyltransferase [Dysgonomonas sp. ZJ709]
MQNKIQIIRTTSDNEDFRLLIKDLDDDLNRRNGEMQSLYDGLNKIESLNTIVIAYDNNTPIGCACFKTFSTHSVELKRMYVNPDYRGLGVAPLILKEIEKWAGEIGFKEIVLETGLNQPEAIRFYTKNGYSKIDNYGRYIGNPNSVCMNKKLMIC